MHRRLLFLVLTSRVANGWRQRQGLPPELDRSGARSLYAEAQTSQRYWILFDLLSVQQLQCRSAVGPGYAVQRFSNTFAPSVQHGLNASVMEETIRKSLHALESTACRGAQIHHLMLWQLRGWEWMTWQ